MLTSSTVSAQYFLQLAPTHRLGSLDPTKPKTTNQTCFNPKYEHSIPKHANISSPHQ